MTMTDVKEPSVKEEVLEPTMTTGTLLLSSGQEVEEDGTGGATVVLGTAVTVVVTPSLSHAESQTDFRTDVLRLRRGGGDYEVDEGSIVGPPAKRKSASEDADNVISREIKRAKLETKALKAKRPGFTDERYNETSYYVENGLRKVYPYYFTFTTFTKGRWVGEKILDVFAREFRAHPVEEYERCIKSGTLTVNYTKVDTDYRLKHNDLLANIVHRHEVPVTSDPIEVVHMDEDLVVVNKPASIPVHPCGRYRHNTVVFILAKEHQLKNLRTIHRLDRLTSGLLLFGRSPKKAREMEQQIRNRQVSKEYVCRVEGEFPEHEIECVEPIEVVSYKIGVCKVSKDGKDCRTTFKKLSYNGKSSVVVARPHTGRMHQIRVHLQYLGYPIVNDPLYNHVVFGPEKGKGGNIGKSDEQLIADLISIHNAENWLGIEGEESGGPSGDIFGPPLPTADSVTGNHDGNSGVGLAADALKSTDTPMAAATDVVVAAVETMDQGNNSASVVALSGSNGGDANAAIPQPVTTTAGGSSSLGITSVSSSSSVATPPPSSIPATACTTQTQTNSSSSEVQTDLISSSSVNGKVTVGTQTCENEPCDASTATASIGTGVGSPASTSSIINNNNSSTGASTPTTSTATSPASTSNNNDPLAFKPDQMTYDPHCYECKVRYRDPKPKDLVMYLHALSYKGPEWCFETKLPEWAGPDWVESDDS